MKPFITIEKLIFVLALSFIFIFAGCQQNGVGEQTSSQHLEEKKLDEIKGELVAELTDPPLVPPFIRRKHATKVIVNLEIIEKEMRMADGVTYTFWTYGGKVPGKFIRVREGDFVEFHLKNHPDNTVPHNIDLHAVTGQGGGASSSFTAPGHESVFSFSCLNPGLYIYHCATAPVGMHIANGMYGLIFVQPKDFDMPEVDREYYVCQGDFYTTGKNGDQGLQGFDMDKAFHEDAEYVLFNGSVGALTGDNALQCKPGERVRLYVGNGGPNLTSAFHVIGEIFDNVYIEGGSTLNHDVQTTLIPPGGSAIVDFRVDVPGNYIIVDHALFRTFNKGALGILAAKGADNKKIYSGKIDDRIYKPEGGAVQSMPDAAKSELTASNKEERIAMGKNVYTANCLACHQADGKGIPKAFPPLVASDYFAGDPNKAISAVANGLEGSITVNSETYNNVMPKQNLSDEQIANVITYVLNNFGNKGGEVTPAQVKSVRK